jgi:hypothetical protein
MFFATADGVMLSVKVAPHMKVPYIGNELSIPISACEIYNNIYNLIQRAKRGYSITYFYTKNNLATYHREHAKSNHFIIPDLLNDSYDVASIKELGYRIESTKDNEAKAIAAKMADGTLYLISNNMTDADGKKFVMILNLSEKRALYKKLQEGHIYISWFYPIVNVIVPIIRVTSEGLFVDLVNLLNGRTNTISCDLSCISQMVKKLIGESQSSNKDLVDTAKRVDGFYLNSVNYEYQIHENNIPYTKRAIIKFRFYVTGHVYLYDMNNVSISIESTGNVIRLYFSFEDTFISVYKSGAPIKYLNNLNGRFLIKENQPVDKIVSIKIHNQLYVDSCYAIYQDKDGFTILGRNRHIGGTDVEASVISYKNYKIFVFMLSDESKRHNFLRQEEWTADGIAVVDTKRYKTLVWLHKSYIDGHCMQLSSIESYYYSDKVQKLILLPSNSDCFSVIDTKKLDMAFNKLFTHGQSECQEEIKFVDDLADSFNITSMIIEEVSKRNRIPPALIKYSDVRVISSYIDKKSDILYIAATYKVSNVLDSYERTKYIGLFMWPIYDDNVRLKLLWYKQVNSKLLYYKPLKSLYATIHKTGVPDMLKLEMRNYNTKWIDLHLGYDFNENIFIDIENNRSSAQMPDVFNIFESNSELISKLENFLFVKYLKRDQYSFMGELCYIVSDKAMVVKRMQFTYI